MQLEYAKEWLTVSYYLAGTGRKSSRDGLNLFTFLPYVPALSFYFYHSPTFPICVISAVCISSVDL